MYNSLYSARALSRKLKMVISFIEQQLRTVRDYLFYLLSGVQSIANTGIAFANTLKL